MNDGRLRGLLRRKHGSSGLLLLLLLRLLELRDPSLHLVRLARERTLLVSNLLDALESVVIAADGACIVITDAEAVRRRLDRLLLLMHHVHEFLALRVGHLLVFSHHLL